MKKTNKGWALIDSEGNTFMWVSSTPNSNNQILLYDTRRRAREVAKALGRDSVRYRVVPITFT